jgi:hypothetical protein
LIKEKESQRNFLTIKEARSLFTNRVQRNVILSVPL